MIENNQKNSVQSGEEELQFDTLNLVDLLSIFIKNNEQAKDLDTSRYLLYRGQSDKTFNLMPSIFRNNRLVNEHKMIQQILLQSPEDFSDIKNPFERLVKMQHY